MKINLEVDIDWLNDGSLDDAVKEQVIAGVTARLEAKFVDGITQEAMNRVNRKIDDLVTNLFEGFMDRGVTVTNHWGEAIKENVTIESLMKDRLDRALTEKVHDDGRPSEYGNKTRLQYMMDERVRKAVEAMTKSVVAEVDAKIAATLNDAIKSRVSASLLAKLDVEGITQKALSELK